METRHLKRYNMWSLGQPDEKASAPATLVRELRDENSLSYSGKLDDFQTSLLLYKYGFPIEATLRGASTLSNGLTVTCLSKKISSESVDFAYDGAGGQRYDKSHVGYSARLNVDEIGSFKGMISSQDPNGFQVKVDAGSKDDLTTKLANLAVNSGVKHGVSIAAGPHITRLEPRYKNCCFEDHNGILRIGTVVNLSRVDALVRARIIPPKPAIIAFTGPDRYAARISGVFSIGFFVTFCKPIPADQFSANIRFFDV